MNPAISWWTTIKSILAFLLLCGFCLAQIPEAPSPRIFTPTFILTHAALAGATVYDIEMTHQGLAHHRCVEQNGGTPNPSRGRLYAQQLGYFAGITLMDVGLKALGNRLQSPRMGELLSSIAPVIGTAKHVNGGTGWATQCW